MSVLTVQTQTVDEHFKLLLKDNSVIDSEATDVTSNDLPDWYNEKLYKEAQNYFKRNMMSIISASTIGLIIVFSVETILKVLICTKRSNSTCLAFKRYIETILHLYNLFICDPKDSDSKWYKSINTIRWHHKIGSKKSKNANIGEISQRDMVLTQYGFLAFIYIAPKSFGLCNTPEENEAFNHLWRVNGHMLGIFDRFNVCRKNAKETTELCQKIKDLYKTCLSKPSPEFNNITSYVLDALWYLDITVNKDAFMAFTYELHDLPYKKLGWYSWLNMKYRAGMFYLFLVPYVGGIVRTCNNYLVLFILWNSQHFPLLAWLKFGKDNVWLNLYPKH
ncbi:uncharacterized protein LOC105834551 isoform X2 [Monomorium pharaonis]|uniref:uncharacterized protein LOC105834551 isoform X2 n=1 Tax=Monomorium pharaonis TaxID=307658 RepID=UPI00063F8DF9|nr:uncharacterized protein LOC105834551 isoform X2 [Monomorium pharaonis]